MQAHDLDAPNLGTMREPRGRGRSGRFLEDHPPMSIEDYPPASTEYDAPASAEYDAPMSVTTSLTKRTSRASTVFLFLFAAVIVTAGTLAWWYYGDQATDLIKTWTLPGGTSKPTAPPDGLAELQQQIKSVAVDLAAVKHTLEQFVANQDQLTRKQEEIARKQEQIGQAVAALTTDKQDITQKISAPPPAKKPAPNPLPKPAQHSAVSTQNSSKPVQVAPPQSLLPPKQ